MIRDQMRCSRVSSAFLTVFFAVACTGPDTPPGSKVADEYAGDAPPAQELPTVQPGVVYTADESAEALTRIDLVSGQTQDLSLPISPHNVQVTEDERLILIAGGAPGRADEDGHGATEHDDPPEVDVEPRADADGPADASPRGEGPGEGLSGPPPAEGGGLLIVLDAETLREHVPAAAVGVDPAHVIADAASRYAYVSDMDGDVVRVVDLEDGGVVRAIPTCAGPHGLRMRPDSDELYVACTGTDRVSVIDTGDGREVAQVEVGEAPVQVGFTPDGQEVYVSVRDEDRVAVIDTETREVIRHVQVGRGPIQLYSTPDGAFVYVANEGTDESPDRTVSVIDTGAGEVVATIPTGSGAHGVVVSDDGRNVFVTNHFEGTVSVIDVDTQSVVETFEVGEGPAGITYLQPPG